MGQSRSNSPRNASGDSAWREVANGIIGGAIVLVTVLGSLILAMQEAPHPPTPAVTVTLPRLTPIASPTLLPATPVPDTAEPTIEQPTPSAECVIPTGWTAYTARAEDTLTGIAKKAGTTVFMLIQGNCLTQTDLVAGQIIYVPPPPAHGITPTATRCGPPRGWVVYYVQRGDTLYGLAVRYQTTVNALAQANCMNADTLRVGVPIYVPPVVFPTFTSSATLPPATLAPTDTPSPTTEPSATPAPPTDTPEPSPTPTPTINVPSPTLTPQPSDTHVPTVTPPPTGTPLTLPTPSS
jgi:LysM repeat protein